MVVYLKVHYCRYLSLTEVETSTIIHKFFQADLAVRDNLYIYVRDQMMKQLRTWQCDWVKRFEAQFEILTSGPSGSLVHRLKDYDQLVEWFDEQFSLENVYSIFEFAVNVVDLRKITNPEVIALY
ncbi:hypothetical protein K440DRAFT_610764 [Wilcoxina mikolae CBS 423.85]|nr:hypothetical protein K440DRAFT_610764 [Wilcoxina mikolae CBS 423.85]